MFQGKPVILVTNDSNNLTIQPGEARHLDCPKPYFAGVANAGGIPVAACEFCPEELAEICDGLLLTGGDDIQPELFGETKHSETVRCDVERDEFEFPLVNAFIARKKPIMGVCRGIQVLAVAMGGSVYQDLVEDVGVMHKEKRLRHEVTAVKGSFFYNAFGEKFRVNSTHHQAVKDPGAGMIPVCRTVDGMIEALEHETLPFFATQFHPERMTGTRWDGTTKDFAPIFDHLIELCKQYAEEHKEK